MSESTLKTGESLEHLRRSLAAAQADPNNPFLVAQLTAAVSIHDAASYLQSSDDRRERQRKRETLPAGYTMIRGPKPYDFGFKTPEGRRYGFWVSGESAREEAWTHNDHPNEFSDPGEADSLHDQVLQAICLRNGEDYPDLITAAACLIVQVYSKDVEDGRRTGLPNDHELPGSGLASLIAEIREASQ